MTLLQWCDHWLLTFSLFVGVERLLDVACWHVVLFVMSLFTALHQCTNTLTSALLHCASAHQYIDVCTTSLCMSAPIHWWLHYCIVHYAPIHWWLHYYIVHYVLLQGSLTPAHCGLQLMPVSSTFISWLYRRLTSVKKTLSSAFSVSDSTLLDWHSADEFHSLSVAGWFAEK